MTEEVATQEPVVENIELHIELPGDLDRITLSVSLTDTIQDIKQVVSSLPSSRRFTNFALTYDSFKVEEALSLLDLIGSHELEEVTELTLHLREEPYTESTAREHILKLREILGLNSNPISDFEGVLSGTSKFQDMELNEIKPAEKETEATEKEAATPAELPAEQKVKAVAAVGDLLRSKDLKEHSIKSLFSLPSAVKSLADSVWNPPTSQQSLKGDLLYLQTQTLEGDVYQITAHVSGFFVNKSTSANFDGSLRSISSSNHKSITTKCHSLLDLLSNLSPKLVEQLQHNAKVFIETQPEVYLSAGNAILANPWIAGNPPKRTPDLAKSQLNYLVGGPDGADLSKDWNEEFQSVRELPRETFPERVMRERLLNRTGYEFTASATKTAVSIIRGELQPINPEEDASLHVFLRNGIFYSFGTDAADRYKTTGGNEAARAAASRDIKSVSSLNKLDINGVCHVLTTIVDYCGQRVVCQAPVPGIFNNDVSEEVEEGLESEKVVYGLSGSGSELFVDEKFKEKFTPIGEAFHLKPHNGWASDGSSEKEVVTSIETKGLKGSDGRDYIIDLYRTTPLDIEFIESHWAPGSKDSYPHREVTLRHEAVEEWWKRQVAVIVKKETEKLEAEKETRSESDEKPTITIAPNEFALNPDAFALDASVVSLESAKLLKDDEERVREVSRFITAQLIPEFISDIATSKSMTPIDGSHLASLLHKRGINIRYLGHLATEVLRLKEETLANQKASFEEIKKANDVFLAKEAEKAKDKSSEEEVATEEPKPEKKKSNADFTPTASSLNSLYIISIQEMVARAVKHVLRDFTSKLPLPLVPSCIAHFHNCLLGGKVNSSPSAEVDDSLKHLYPDCDFSYIKLTPTDVVSLVSSEVYIRYRYTLPELWNETLIKSVPLLREISIKFGIQWKSRNYAFTAEDAKPPKAAPTTSLPVKSKKKGKKSSPEAEAKPVDQLLTFNSDDILSVYPVVKDSIYKSTLVEEIWEAGRFRVQSEGERELGLSLLTESVQFYEQIYGNIHPDVGKAYSVLAQTYHDLGLFDKACEISRKAVIILERSLGFDSHDTLLALVNTAFFENANDNSADALAMYSRVLGDWSVVFGKEHPSFITTLTNIATLLQEKRLFKEAASILNSAIELSIKTNTETSQITAMLRYQLAQYHLMDENIESAVSEMEKAYATFKVTVGEEDALTEDSKKWFEALTAFKTRREEVATKQEQNAKKLDTGNVKKVKKNGKLLQSTLSEPKLKKATKQSNQISVPEIANQSVDDILAFIEGQTPSKKKSKASKK